MEGPVSKAQNRFVYCKEKGAESGFIRRAAGHSGRCVQSFQTVETVAEAENSTGTGAGGAGGITFQFHLAEKVMEKYLTQKSFRPQLTRWTFPAL